MGDHYMLGKRKQEAIDGGPLHARKKEMGAGGGGYRGGTITC